MENEIMAATADEGNTIVILKKSECINKTKKFITEGLYNEINYDYPNKFQARIRK